jgi:uncharacterized protein (TIRG00374 family)
MQQKKPRGTPRRKALIIVLSLVIFALAGYVIIAQWPNFAHGWHVLRVTNPLYGVLAFTCVAIGVSGSALLYRAMATRPVKLMELLHVAWAGMFVNRLLPAGVGGMGLYVDYLVRRGHAIAEASGVVALSGFITMLGHVVLIVLFVAVGASSVSPTLELPSWLPWALVAIGLIVLVVLGTQRRRVLQRLRRIKDELLKPLGRLLKQPKVYLRAQSAALLITCGNAVALTLAMYVSGVELGFTDAIIILASGVAAGALTPTPGGLVGTEAGLATAMTLYGAAPADALSAVLLYRLASFWVPLLAGIFALVLSRRRGYI